MNYQPGCNCGACVAYRAEFRQIVREEVQRGLGERIALGTISAVVREPFSHVARYTITSTHDYDDEVAARMIDRQVFVGDAS